MRLLNHRVRLNETNDNLIAAVDIGNDDERVCLSCVQQKPFQTALDFDYIVFC